MPRPFQQHAQKCERLIVKFDAIPLPTKLAFGQVKVERPEPVTPCLVAYVLHFRPLNLFSVDQIRTRWWISRKIAPAPEKLVPVGRAPSPIVIGDGLISP